MKKNAAPNQGFSLIELIVVVTIISILTTLLVPALLDRIQKAREDSVVAECKNCVLAARTVALDNQASGKPISAKDAMKDPFITEVRRLAQTPTDGKINGMAFEGYLLSELSYTNRDITVRYVNGLYLTGAGLHALIHYNNLRSFAGRKASCHSRKRPSLSRAHDRSDTKSDGRGCP